GVTFTYLARAGSGGPASAPVTVTLNAAGSQPAVTLEKVGFLNGQTLVPDDGSTEPVQAQWRRTGDPVGDSVRYAVNDVMDVQVVRSVSQPERFRGAVQVRGEGGGLVINGTAYLDGLNRLVVSKASVLLPDEVDYFDPLVITWRVLPPGRQGDGGWVEAGSSSNNFFLTSADVPKGDKLWETVVEIGTKAVKGR